MESGSDEDVNLEEMFVEYCPKINDALQCVDQLVKGTEDCLSDEEYKEFGDLVTLVNVTLDFVCYNKGERVMSKSCSN